MIEHERNGVVVFARTPLRCGDERSISVLTQRPCVQLCVHRSGSYAWGKTYLWPETWPALGELIACATSPGERAQETREIEGRNGFSILLSARRYPDGRGTLRISILKGPLVVGRSQLRREELEALADAVEYARGL